MPFDEQLLSKLASLSGEYLFFLGATYLALLLAHRRRVAAALASFAVGTVWITFHLPVSLYLGSLGPDSMAETSGFDLREARFWLHTLDEAVYPMFSLKKFSFYLVVAVTSFYAVYLSTAVSSWRWRRAFTPVVVIVATASMLWAVKVTTADTIASYGENAQLLAATEGNFRHAAPALRADPQAPDLVVYIGESTSVMNMGLYGYPRDTTPRLSRMAREDNNLLVFHHVFSTHSHTSRSLLEALSFGRAGTAEAFLTIERRQRLPIVDVFNQAGLAPRLVSTQGYGGGWDHTASVIFRRADTLVRVKEPLAADGVVPPRWDDEYFAAEFDRQARQGPRRVTFLHSYAGHGPYYENIPERFRVPVDQALVGVAPARVVDAVSVSVAQVEAYDAAIRYVDYSVASVMARARASARPTVVVYFSDHGDAVFRGRGHDSARFSHEMARVPLLMYFNDAARQARPAVFRRYQALAARREVATLAQLPSTLADLMGLRLEDAPVGAARFVTTPVLGEPTVLPPVMIRERGDAVTAINLNTQAFAPVTPQGRRLVDRTDDDTALFVAVRAGRVAAASVCARPAASLEAMGRHILVADCDYPALMAAPTLPANSKIQGTPGIP